MTARYTFILCCLLSLVGCFAPGDKRFLDLPRHEGNPTVKEITAEGDLLRISVVQDGNVVLVAGIEPLLIEGDVYLRQCVSAVWSMRRSSRWIYPTNVFLGIGGADYIGLRKMPSRVLLIHLFITIERFTAARL